jgi:hypothetical protein
VLVFQYRVATFDVGMSSARVPTQESGKQLVHRSLIVTRNWDLDNIVIQLLGLSALAALSSAESSLYKAQIGEEQRHTVRNPGLLTLSI